MHRQLLFLFFLLFLAEGLIPQTKENLIQSTSTSALTMSEAKKNIEEITELSQVAYTDANEKAPVIVGTSSYLYAIYEYKLGSNLRAIKIRISTNNGTSWNDWDLISNTLYNLGTPYAYIAGSKLYIVWQVEYSTTDYDIEFCSYNVGATPSGLSVTWVEQSGNNTFRPVVAVTSSDIYVGYVNGGTGKFQIRRSSNNGSSWSDIFTSSTNFVYPSTLLRTDGTASGTNMFVFNTKISNVDQVVVLTRTGTSTWSETYVSSSSGNKSGPSIGTYGNNWIVAFQGTSSNVKYFYKSSSASSPTEYTLATNATFPTVEMTDSPSGFVVCTYVKNQKVYKVTSGVAQLPTWSSETALYSDNLPPSTDDFIGLHPSGSNAGVVFANPYLGSTSDYDVYYGGLSSETNCTLSIQPTTKTIGAEGGSFTISVSATCNWTASESANWISITPSSGNGNGSINVTVAPNTSFNSRTDVVAIASGTTGVVCTITQSGASQTLMISPEEYSAPSANAGSFTISVSSNLNWSASSNQSWITVNPQNGSNNGTITVNYTANPTSGQRTGMVTVEGGLISVFCDITQPPATTNQLTIDPTTHTAPSSAAGSFPITVSSNVSWTASDDQTWLSVTPQSGSNNGTLNVSYTDNTSGSTRTGTVTVSGGNITKQCVITQPAPIVGSVPLTVSAPSQVIVGAEFWIDIKVGSNEIPVTNLKIISFEFNYQQANLLEYISHEVGPFITGASANVIPDPTNGKISASVYRTSGGNSGSGVVLRLKFRVVNNAPANSTVNYNFTNILANNSDGNQIPILPSTASSQILSGLVVWPGDTNNDGVVNIIDINPIIINFNSEGPVRSNASPAWVGQICSPWTPQARTYADANGGGKIEITDINMVIINFTRTHTLKNPGDKLPIPVNPLTDPPLLANSNVSIAPPGTQFEVKVFIGSASLPVTNVQVLSFELHYSNQLALYYDGFVMGDFFTSAQQLVMPDTAQGIISTSVYRTAGGNSGYGQVITFKFRVKENANPNTLIDFNFQNIQANRVGGELQPLSPMGVIVPVPVELTSFTGSAVNGKVLLNWATATEMNNKGFEVERRASDAAWQNIGYVQGSGTTTEPRLYSFTDATLTKDGNYEYRLKQVDHNGDFEYSKVISVNVTVTPENFALYQNYPNPFNPSTQISYSLPTGSYVKLVLYDAIGNVAGYIYEGYKEAGHHSINYDASHLTNGVYYYQITAGEFRAVKKLILMK